MKCPLRHLPLLALTAVLLMGGISCGSDEPIGNRHGSHDDPTPTDTTSQDTTSHSGTDTIPNDTTSHHDTDTTTTPRITIGAPRDYGYMGQTMQLTVTNTATAAVKWRSSRSAVASVGQDGLVTFNNLITDSTTVITATAGNACDSLTLTNRCWHVAAWSGTAWVTPAYHSVHPGDTITLTIVDSEGRAINDQGFNAGACEWSATCRTADVAAVITAIDTPSGNNGWQYRWVINAGTAQGTIVNIMARHGYAASTLACLVN